MAIADDLPPAAIPAFLRRLAVLALVVALVGIPINHQFGYGLLVVAAVVLFTGDVAARPRAWAIACSIVAAGLLGKWLLVPSSIEEGHNVFLVEHADGLKTNLPDDVYRFMAGEFDKQYPPERRCDPDALLCWRGFGLSHYLRMNEVMKIFPTYRTCLVAASGCPQGFPVRTFAFSADGIFQSPLYSRRVTSIDFSDPAWLRLGFLNDGAYNWSNDKSDVRRAVQEPGWRRGLHRWRVTMPWFVMYQFPPAYAGSLLCWRGDVLWETTAGAFEALRHDREECRPLTAWDVGRRIFGVAIRPGTLAMRLDPPRSITIAHWSKAAVELLGVAACLMLLVRPNWRRTILPAAMIGITIAIVAMIDVTTLGGFRAHEGSNDGLYYEAAGRVIVQHLLAGDVASALEGTEAVYWFGGPGIRYVRALERIVFGDTNLGFLSILFALPIVVWIVFRRFLDIRWALVLTLIFIATPIGAFFGSTFALYVKYALQGFGDPAAYMFFLAGLAVIAGPAAAGPSGRFGPAFAAALLLALATWIRPVIAPGVAVLLGGGAIAALSRRQWLRVAGLFTGFLPTLLMPLHNWYFGDAIVLFSANVSGTHMPVTPSDYAAALWELLRLDLDGPHVQAVNRQLIGVPAGFLGQSAVGGTVGYLLALPVHIAAIVVAACVAFCGRRFELWLRLAAGSVVAQLPIGFFYAGAPRYYFLTWLLAMLVLAAWLQHEGLAHLCRLAPVATKRIRRSRPAQKIRAALDFVVTRLDLRPA